MRSKLLEICARAVHTADLSTCKPLGFDLLGWITILTAVVGVIFFVIRRGETSASASPSATIPWRPWRSRFRAVCATIKPMMDENGRLFEEFGPNSGRDGGPKKVRYDLSVWKQTLPKIVGNNAKIREVIEANRPAIPAEHQRLFTTWINHIDAFEAHAADDLVDYRENQFPIEVVQLVGRCA